MKNRQIPIPKRPGNVGSAAAGACPASYGFIGGGSSNVICAGACHSAIIGGSGNTVTHNWATVSGCNVATVIDNSFHTNNVLVQDIPLLGFGASRQLQYVPAPAILGLPTGTLLVVTT